MSPENEFRYAQAMEAIGDGVYDWDVTTSVVYFAPSYYTIAGYDPGDFPMNFESWSSRVHPDDLSQVFKDVEEFMSGRTDVYSPKFRFRRKDDSWMWLMARAKIVERDKDGSPTRVIGVHTDIDQFIQAEEQLLEARDQAEKASKAKSEFLASMSHELRTPMNAVLGFAQMMQYDPRTNLSEIQNNHVSHIIEGGNHLLELINDVLDLSKIEADHLSLTLEQIDSAEIVADAVLMSASLGNARNITVVDKFSDAASVMLQTDSMRFKQCLLNLISNAVKYNKDGGVVTLNGQETEDGFLRISVTDTGLGIAKRDFAGMFQMFHRLNGDPTVAKEGTGIGLTVTKLLIERMAGRIGFDSEEGVGSTFWIELPLASNHNVLIWSSAMKVGIDEIDSDHHTLVSLLNKIMNPSIDRDELNQRVDEFIDSTKHHFQREEAIMDVCEYPNHEEHRKQHQELLTQITEHVAGWRAGTSMQDLSDLWWFLQNWLFKHIMKEDTQIVFYARDKAQLIKKSLQDLD